MFVINQPLPRTKHVGKAIGVIMNQQNKYIAYLRVSTNKQGQSGLGLDAQREMISRFFKVSRRVNKNNS